MNKLTDMLSMMLLTDVKRLDFEFETQGQIYLASIYRIGEQIRIDIRPKRS